MTHFVGQKGKFPSICVIFFKKNAILAYKLGHNSVKIQNFQNPIRTFVAGTIGRLYTKNRVNWSIFDWVITFSVEKVVPKSQREKRKKLQFSGKKSANFQNFLNFFINSIQLPEIHTWSKFQLIWAICWRFMTILDSIFDHFYIYNLL